MSTTIEYVIWLGAIGAEQAAGVAPHQVQLSSLLAYGMPVLPGFVLTGDFFDTLLEESGLDRTLGKELSAVDWQNSRSIAAASKKITTKLKSLIVSRDLSVMLQEAINQLAERLHSRSLNLLVQPAVVGAVSVPIQLPDYLPAIHFNGLNKAIISSLIALFDPTNLSSVTAEELVSGRLKLSLLIQPVLAVEQSGLLTTGQTISVEAIYGRPEPLLEQTLTPDRYTIDSETLTVLNRDINRQSWQLTDVIATAKHRKVSSLDQTAQKIDDDQIAQLSKWALAAQQQSESPLRLVWQIDHQQQFWITAILPPPADLTYNMPADGATEQLITIGKVLAPGRAVGLIRFHRPRQESETTVDGESILVAETLDHIMPRSLQSAKAIIVESAHVRHDLVVMAKEEGLPIIVVPDALQILTEGQLITVDGRTGEIYRGKQQPVSNLAQLPKVTPITGTKIFTYLIDLDEEAVPSDGIGLFSTKALIGQAGDHPRLQLETLGSKAFINGLIDELCDLAGRFRPRPIIYCPNDLLTTDYQALTGSTKHEKTEANPILGYRGAHRLLREPDLTKLEFEAVRRVRDDYGYTNLHLMLPFVRTQPEFTALSQLIVGAGLRPGHDFRLWLLAQTPSSLALLESLATEGAIQGICLDTDSLCQLLLGVDQNNVQLTDEYDLRDPVVMAALTNAIAIARRAGVAVTAVGRSLDRFPDAIEPLVAAGLTGLVVPAESVTPTRQLVASIEQRVILEHVTNS